MSGFPCFEYRDNELYVESVPLSYIGKTFGTPCYVYSKKVITDAYQAFDTAFADNDHLICYSVKANANIAILNLLARLGSGFDIVSGGELQRVLKAGGDPRKIVFSGVGKNTEEMRLALAAKILCFNVESEAELDALNQIAAEMRQIASVSLRVNPDVDAKTHPYISTGLKENKFGIPIDDAERICTTSHGLKHIRFTGLDCHIGSQLTELEPFAQACDRILNLVSRIESKGIEIEHLDLGGGLGIRYRGEEAPSIREYVESLCANTSQLNKRILIEPGRALIGNAGLLLTRVEYLKQTPDKNFAVVDAAMNDLMRPALYDAYHEILPVIKNDANKKTYQVVGPICETGDFLGHDRELNTMSGDTLAVMSSGAYGMSMSSNYNTRPRVPEVMVDGDDVYLIRERETIDHLIATEKILP